MPKREADNYLTDRNYNTINDNDDDDVEGSTFKRASEDVLSKRKIKPLKRRSRVPLKQQSDKPSTFSSFSFKPSTTNTTDDMKEKIKKFTEQICGLNKSFVSFLSKSIEEDVVFDISLNISQYQEKRKEIEKDFEDVIQYLTNNKDALKSTSTSNFSFKPQETNTTKSTFSFTKPTEEKPKETKPFSFGFGNNNSTSTTTNATSTFTFNKPDTTKTTPTFSFSKPDAKTTPTFSFNKPDANKTTPTFSFGKPNDKTSTPPTFSFSKPDSKQTSGFTFNLNKDKTDDNKDDASSKPIIPTFKPFNFNFGQKMADASGDQGKTLPKPNFSFGVAPPSKTETSTASNDDEEEPAEQAQLTTGAGEEDEDTVFEVKAKIHHYNMEEKKYVPRGVGLLKVNKNKKTNKSRLLGRMDNGTVFLNVSLFKEMVVNEPVNSNQFSFNAMDRLEGSDDIKMIRFAVRVKDKENAKKLYDAIIENKN